MTVTFLDVSDSEKLELQSRRNQDENFCEALARAIRDGLEQAPLGSPLGVNTVRAPGRGVRHG